MTSSTLALQQFPEKLAVVRLPSGSEIPTWAESSSLFSITATALETSLVCAGRDVPTKVVAQRGLIGFALEPTAETDPTAAGVLLELLEPLAEAGIGVQVISTHQTVWVLVPSTDVERAAEQWRRRGHEVHLAVPVTPERKQKR